MIYDKIENLRQYRSISPMFQKAVDHILRFNFEQRSYGEFDIDGSLSFGFYRTFPLKPEADLLFENHQRYIDIQCVVSGSEAMICANAATLPLAVPYSEEKDIAFYGDGDHQTKLILRPGDFAVFFPWDAHKPCCQAEGCTLSHKWVVKVAANG